MALRQQSRLLSELFAPLDPDARLTVLNIGAALPETVEFFSNFRCKLIFADLFAELPFSPSEEEQQNLPGYYSRLLNLPAGTSLDICLFWDVFNYLDKHAIAALMGALRPALQNSTRAHGFAVHNRLTPQTDQVYGICDLDTLNVRGRPTVLPGYTPHPQSELRRLLPFFNVDRSVLLPDSRLELLLQARPD